MPDLINPLFSSVNNIDRSIPNIIPDPEFPKWKSPEVQIPESLSTARSVFDSIPQNEISLAGFTSVINEMTPAEQKQQAARAQAMAGLTADIQLPKQGPSFRFFNSREALRYKQNPRLWKEAGYNPEVPTDIMDAIYDHNETKWESIKNVFPKLWSTTSFAFKNYYAEYADAANAIAKLDANMLHNSSRFTDYAEEQKLLEDLHPDYKTDNPTKWYQMWRGDYWEESGSSLGFTLGTLGAALAENAAISVATLGIGESAELVNTPRKIFKAIGDYYSLKRAYSLVKGAVGAKTILGKLGNAANIWRLTNGALSEAAFEGATNANEYLDQYKQDFITKNGYAPTDQQMSIAKAAANKMANATILFETPFLMASNAIQFGNLVAPKTIAQLTEKFGLKKAAYELGLKDFMSVVNPTEKQVGRVGKALSGVKNSLWEGTEESYQALVTTSTRDYYNDKYFNKDDASILKSLGAGFDYITSNQGLKEFTAGFATGAIFSVPGKLVNRFAKPKEELKTNEKTGEVTTEYKYNFLNKLFGWGLEDVHKQQVRDNLQKIADAMNSVKIEDLLKEDGLFNMIRDNKTALALAKFVETGDIFNLHNAQNLQLNRFLFAGLHTGKIDLQIQKLQDFAKQDFETLKDFFNLDESNFDTKAKQDAWMEGFRGFAASLSEKSKEFENIYNREKNEYQGMLSAAGEEHDNAVKEYNKQLTEYMEKYNVEDPELLSQKLSNEEKLRMHELNKAVIGYKFRYYGVNEALKASVLAQAGMMDDAKRAKDILYQLSSNNTSKINYMELGNLFDISYRDNRLKDLELKLKNAQETGAPNIDLIKEQLNHFKALKKMLDNQFNNNHYSPKKINDLADVMQRYLYSVQKEYNKLDNNTPLEERIHQEELDNFNLMKDFIKLQAKQQENLNLYNYLSSTHNKEDYTNFQSRALTDFFSQVVDLVDKEENAAAEKQVAELEATDKKEETKPVTENPNPENPPPPPPPPSPTGGTVTIGDSTIDTDTSDNAEVDEENVPELAEVDDSKPILYETSFISSNRDTDDIKPGVEKLRTTLYDELRIRVIKEKLAAMQSSGQYKFFIAKDNYPEVYKGSDIVEMVNGQLQFKAGKGHEVIIVEDKNGKQVKIKDILPDVKSELAELPLIFSFEGGKEKHGMFFNHLFDSRVTIKAQKTGKDRRSIVKEFNDESALNARIREHIKANPTAKVPLNILAHTTGIHPMSRDYAPVQERFGDFEFKVIKPLYEGGDDTGTPYKKGTIIATAGPFEFPVATDILSSYKDIAAAAVAALKHEYKTFEEAESVKNEFLKLFVITSKKKFFTIDKEGDVYKIYFKTKAEDGSYKRESVLNSKLNVSAKALEGGYKLFDATTGKLSILYSPESYKKLIQPKLLTRRKKVLNHSDQPYSEPVNSYFSFSPQFSPVEDKSTKQKSAYNYWHNRIMQLASEGTLNRAEMKSTLSKNAHLFAPADYKALFKVIETVPITVVISDFQKSVDALNLRKMAELFKYVGKYGKEIREYTYKDGYFEGEYKDSYKPSLVDATGKTIITGVYTTSQSDAWRQIREELVKRGFSEEKINQIYSDTTPVVGTYPTKEEINLKYDIELVELKRQNELNKGAVPNVQDYIKEEVERNVNANRPLIPKVIELAYQNKTKAEIAKALNVDPEVVNSIRTYLQIPSMDSKTEFNEWKAKIDAINEKYDKELSALKSKEETGLPSQPTATSIIEESSAPIKEVTIEDELDAMKEEDIREAIFGKKEEVPVYKASVGPVSFEYDAALNSFFTTDAEGNKQEYSKVSNMIGKIMDAMVAAHPHFLAEDGTVRGFKKVEVQDGDTLYRVFITPTDRPNSEFILNRHGLNTNKTLQQLKDIVQSEEAKKQIEEIENLYC